MAKETKFTEEELNWIWEGISLYTEDGATIDIRDETFGLQYVIQKTITGSKEINDNLSKVGLEVSLDSYTATTFATSQTFKEISLSCTLNP